MWKNIFVVGAGFFASFLGLGFNSNEASALFVPTLSASVDQANLQVNGNQVINSTDKTIEIPFNFTVNTNNRTGYTATLNSETNNTALTNATSTVGAKIDSISTNLTLNNLPNNTWGYKFGASSNYVPIPALSTPAQILQTTGKTNGNESNQLSIGMKLADNLESGNYTNKLILSFVSNPYTMRAVMMNGPDFNTKIRKLSGESENSINNGFNNVIFGIERSNVVDQNKNLISVDEPDSDYQIFAWFDNDTKTIKYYSEGQKIFLNSNSSKAFIGLKELHELDVSNFDTRSVTNMNHMFSSMHKLKQLQLPATFNTSGVTDMGYMFYNSKSLTSLDVSMFDTEKVTNMREMFGYLESVTSIKFGSGFNTKNVTDMYGMFGTLCNMRELDLSGAIFDTAKVNDFDAMFSVFGCTSGSGILEKIYVNNDFDLTSAKIYKASNPTSNLDIFHKQPLLRGAMGSYWPNPGDANFDGLRIDRAGVKGYFTRKP